MIGSAFPVDEPKSVSSCEVERESFGNFSVLKRRANGEAPHTPHVHFAHATGFNAFTYRRLLESFDPRLEISAMDTRGHGMTTAPADPRWLRSWSQLADDTQQWIEQIDKPVVLAGHSMGASISLALAARMPERVKGVVLVDPVFIPYRLWSTMWFGQTFGLTKHMRIARSVADRKVDFESESHAVEHFVGRGAFRRWTTPWIEDYVRGGSRTTERGVQLTCSAAWEAKVYASIDYTMLRAAKRAACPITLLLAGRSAPTRKPAFQRFLSLAPHARAILTSDLSHFIPMERPDFVRDEIERLISF